MGQRFLMLLAVTLAWAALPLPGDAAVSALHLSGCQSGNGTYQVTVTASDAYGPMHLHTDDPVNGHICRGTVAGIMTVILDGIPEGSTVQAINLDNPSDDTSLTVNSGLPACGNGSTGGAKPLFDMWLLTGGGKYCILVSDTHPSAERQKALCFPGEGWVAEQVLCKGTLYDNDFWKCDIYGKERLHVDDLMRYYERHQIEVEEEPVPATPDPT